MTRSTDAPDKLSPLGRPGTGGATMQFLWPGGSRTVLSKPQFSSVQFSCSVVSESLDPMDHSTPGLPVHHQLPEFIQTHVH